MTTVVKNRRRAAAHQGFRCYYCGLPMWETDPENFASRYQPPRDRLPDLRCTAEHLIARCDGGGDHANNIVAAHRFCNAHRHMMRKALTPEMYKKRVTRRMRQGRWLSGVLSVPDANGKCATQT